MVYGAQNVPEQFDGEVRGLSKSFLGHRNLYDSPNAVVGRSIAVGWRCSIKYTRPAEERVQLPKAKLGFYKG